MADHDESARVENPADHDDGVAREGSPAVDALTAEFDDLLARMQTPEARAAMRDAFEATPEELGRAAVAAARRARHMEAPHSDSA